MADDLIKISIPAVLAFLVGIAITPTLSGFFYRHRLWKQISRKDTSTNPEMSLGFQKIHNEGEEIKTPRVGGIVIWGAVMITMALIFFVFMLVPSPLTEKLEFVSRNQTLLPLVALFTGAFVGLFEDFLEIRPRKNSGINGNGHGLSGKNIVLIVTLIGFLYGLWYHAKLGANSIHVPILNTDLYLGIFFVPFFILVMLGTFSSRVIDGVDGLSGGVLATAFASYTVIALTQNQIDLAAFSATVMGGILAFLWFNVPPARFYMGETGMLALTLALTTVAFLSDQVLLLPVIGLPLVVTSLSSFIQMTSKKYFGRKIFRVAPLHHHFESLGWSRPKITMRYWIISLVCAAAGIVISLV